MTRPTPQRCPVCRTRFMGSDALGKPCPRCREIQTDPGASVADYIAKHGNSMAGQRPVHLQRSEKQAKANDLDMHVFRIVREMEEFGHFYSDSNIFQAATELSFSRKFIRAHMHRLDRERTE